MEYTNSQIRELIAEHIHNARDRELLTDRLVDGVMIEDLAAKYDRDPRTICRKLHKLEEKLFSYL